MSPEITDLPVPPRPDLGEAGFAAAVVAGEALPLAAGLAEALAEEEAPDG